MNQTRPEEEAVIEAGLAKGYFTRSQLDQLNDRRAKLRESGQATTILPLLGSLLDSAQQAELRRVFQDAMGQQVTLGREGAPRTETHTSAPLPVDSAVEELDSSSWLEEPLEVVSVLSLESDSLVVETPAPGALTAPPPSPSGRRGVNADAGKLIGNYELIRELGRGGMGVVYEARSQTLNRKVALKVLLKGASGGDVERFKVEGQAVARLRHDNIVGVLEQGQGSDGEWYMAMDLVEGETLIERVERGAIPAREGAEQAYLLAEALAYAHEQQVLHRDLKPHNVLLEPDGTPKLTDFGLAKLTGGDRGTTLTRSGEMLGTPCYMAPEQIRAERGRIDERTDVYGLGATIYHMLTGTVPFDARSVTTVFAKIMSDAPRPLRELQPDIPKDLETIVLKCLEKDPEERYPGARALARDLSRFLKDLDIVAQRVSGVRKVQRWAGRNRPFVSVLGVAVVLVAGVGGYAAHAISTARAEKDRLAEVRARDAAELARLREAAAAGDRDGVVIDEPPDVDGRETPEATTADRSAPRRPTSSVVTPPRTAEEPPESDEPKGTSELGGLLDSVGGSPAGSSPHPAAEAPAPKPRRLESEVPPTWLFARVDQVRGASNGSVVVAHSWSDACGEAAARNVPIVLVASDPGLRETPAVFDRSSVKALLRSEAVVVVTGPQHVRAPTVQHPPPPRDDLQRPREDPRPRDGWRRPEDEGRPPRGPNRPPLGPDGRPVPLGPDGRPLPPREHGRQPPPPRQERPEGRVAWDSGDPCPVFPAISCRDHMNVAESLVRLELSLRRPSQNGIRVHTLRPDGGFIKTIGSVTTRGLRSGIARAQRKIGAVKLPAKDLDAFAPLLVGGIGEIRKLNSVKTRAAELRRGATFAEPFGTLVRAQQRELCERGIELISGSPHPAKKKRSLLEALRIEFKGNAACNALFDRALSRL